MQLPSKSKNKPKNRARVRVVCLARFLKEARMENDDQHEQEAAYATCQLLVEALLYGRETDSWGVALRRWNAVLDDHMQTEDIGDRGTSLIYALTSIAMTACEKLDLIAA
jgi:hypothetical protein